MRAQDAGPSDKTGMANLDSSTTKRYRRDVLGRKYHVIEVETTRFGRVNQPLWAIELIAIKRVASTYVRTLWRSPLTGEPDLTSSMTEIMPIVFNRAKRSAIRRLRRSGFHQGQPVLASRLLCPSALFQPRSSLNTSVRRRYIGIEKSRRIRHRGG